MRIKQWLFSALLLMGSIVGVAQNRDTSFAKEWLDIDTLIAKDNYTKTALTKVDQLYKLAKASGNHVQKIKCLLYQYALENKVTDKESNEYFNLIRNEIKTTSDPATKSLLLVIYAKYLQKYFNVTAWRLYQRQEQTTFDPDNTDLWTAKDFQKEIGRQYLEALKPAEVLMRYSLEQYEAIVLGSQKGYNLYDLLVLDAINHFKYASSRSSNIQEGFTIDQPSLYAPVELFINTPIPTKDSTSNDWITLELYRKFLSYQYKNRNSLLISTDVERIQWVHEKNQLENKTTLYTNALTHLIAQNRQQPAITEAYFLLAASKLADANQYRPLKDSTNRYAKVEAREWIEQAWKQFPDSTNPGMAKMLNLLSDIKRKSVTAKTELVNIPNAPFRSLVSYQNIDSLYFRIIKATPQIEKILEQQSEYNDQWAALQIIPPFRSWLQILPDTKDHQEHKTEIAIQALPSGKYALLCSPNKLFKDTSTISYQIFHVSNISYINNGRDIFVMNRETGQPLKDVRVIVKRQEYDSKTAKNYYEKIAEGKTNSNGLYRIKHKDPEEDEYLDDYYLFEFSKGKDNLSITRQQYISPVEEDDEEINEEDKKRIHFFTDRGIYRPGQQVYYKGIITSIDSTTRQPKIISKKNTTWIFLYGPKNIKIDSAAHQTNEFGSFSGSFRLPTQGQTGEYYITTDNRWVNYVNFSVEEYKRPTFSIDFDEVKGTYRLNDSISVTGKVIAYAGNNISYAKVKYQVSRNTRFRMPWYWSGRYPYSNSKNLLTGETTTDASGKFTIRFKASAEEIKNQSYESIFIFNTNIDVTDMNGETRSGKKDIAIGTKSVKLSITAPSFSEADSLHHIGVSLTNFNDQPENGLVSLKLIKLQAPDRMIRSRIWERPDQFTLSKEAFHTLFPNDEYSNDLDPSSWARDQIIYQDSINTAQTKQFTVKQLALNAGVYLAIVITKDRDGKEISNEEPIYLYNSQQQKNAIPTQLLTIIGQQQAIPGTGGTFQSTTDIPQVNIIQQVIRPNKPESYNYIIRKKGFHSINVAATPEDRGGISLIETFVYQNRVYQQQLYLDVPWKDKQLDLEYSSYRNKVEPGNKEKWEIKVRIDSTIDRNAEILTSMYDASLDQFTPFNWSKPSLWQSTKVRFNRFQWNENFTSGIPGINYIDIKSYPVYEAEKPSIGTNIDPLVRRNLSFYNLLSLIRDKRAFMVDGDFNRELQGKVNGVELLEVVTTGYTASSKAKSSTAAITIRGTNSLSADASPVYIVNGEIVDDPSSINPQDIENATILKGSEATSLYGARAAYGAIVISGKGGKKPTPPPVVPRRNFNETAFFYPQVYADSAGTYTISFTVPDALTKWKWQSFAHTKDLAMGLQSTSIVSQRTLMVQANAPRFLREGDKMEFSGKISNMSDKELSGQVTLELIDATTGTSVDGWFQNMFPTQYFTVEAGQSSPVKFPIQIPFSYNKPLTWRLVARAGNFSDGEENILPVLSNRQLVIESMPLLLLKDTVQSFSFDKLIKANSPSLTHQSLTINYTANPIWEAIRALPYLMEYPYECAEQSFNRFYANAIGSYIVNKNPKIKHVLTAWLKDSTALKGKLSSNQALKQILLEETPWVLEAHNEAEQQAQLAALLDLIRMDEQTKLLIDKLNQLQSADGSFSWFKGGSPNPYMTNYILTGIGKLKRIGAITPNIAIQLRSTIEKAMAFMDQHMNNELTWLKKNRLDTARSPLSGSQINYLYMRSFFRDMAPDKQGEAYRFFYDKGKQTLTKQSLYEQALLGMVYYRNNEKRYVNVNIVPVLLDNAIEDKKLGMLYWKDRTTYSWYGNPIEHQSTLIQFLQEVQQEQYFAGGKEKLAMARNWLLMNKQTNHWNTTIATADACYSLLVTGNDATFNDRKVRIQLGDRIISNDKKAEAGTGFFTETIEGRFVQPTMGNVKVSVSTTGAKEANTLNTSWGSINWQYFEDMDKISSSTGNPLSVSKQLFREISKGSDRVLEPVQENDVLHPGDKVVVRMVISSTKDIEYVHLKDTRASSMEPVNVLSSYKWQDGLGYYESTRDASTNFFFDQLRKGRYVFDYPVFITHLGTFSTGVASIQCMYAPEFNAHSGGTKIRVEE